jgi:hypothetical protein
VAGHGVGRLSRAPRAPLTAIRWASSVISARRRMTARLLFKLHLGERLLVVVAHDEAGVIVVLFDRPRRRETAGGITS